MLRSYSYIRYEPHNLKRVHPPGKCDEEALMKLANLEHDSEEIEDPRWEGLKNIKKDLK